MRFQPFIWPHGKAPMPASFRIGRSTPCWNAVGPLGGRKAIQRSTQVLVADVGGMVAGYATLGPIGARQLQQKGEIYELYVRPEYQGFGLGYRLLGRRSPQPGRSRPEGYGDVGTRRQRSRYFILSRRRRPRQNLLLHWPRANPSLPLHLRLM